MGPPYFTHTVILRNIWSTIAYEYNKHSLPSLNYANMCFQMHTCIHILFMNFLLCAVDPAFCQLYKQQDQWASGDHGEWTEERWPQRLYWLHWLGRWEYANRCIKTRAQFVPEPDPAPPKSDLAPHLGGSSSSRANERRLCWPIPCIYFMKNLLLWACLPHIYIWNNEFERAKKRDMTECDIHAFSFATLYIYLRQTDCAFENTHQGGHFDDCERASIEWLKNKSANYTFLWRCHDPIRQVKFVNCPETQVKVLEQRAAALVVQTRCADVKPLWESEREDAVQLN